MYFAYCYRILYGNQELMDALFPVFGVFERIIVNKRICKFNELFDKI